MPYGSPYDEEARFFRQFLKMGSPISPSNLRISKDEKILLCFSPIFVIWSFNSPTGGERENLSFFHKSGPNDILFSSWGVKGEKIINFLVSVEKRFSILQQVVKRKIFFDSVEKRLSNVQPGSEDTQQPRKEVHR